ncbi:MAG: SBBP repeat-containing protein [Crocinitomicaceae bacterium]|nr:SBBP repeat-containing protein [Crocinitomicaceae bacterium]
MNSIVSINNIYFITIFLGFCIRANSQSFEWVRVNGGISGDVCRDIVTDNSGNCLTIGAFNDSVDFDPGPGSSYLVSNGGSDVFVCKYDSSGVFQWAKGFGGLGNDQGYSIDVDIEGNVYVIGAFLLMVDFNPGPAVDMATSSEERDIYILKLDQDGNFVWVRTIGGGGTEIGSGIKVDGFGNVYTTGQFVATVDFDTGPDTLTLTSFGGYDAFVHKMDTSGNFIWVKKLGGTSHDRGYRIQTDSSGNVYSTGQFSSIADFDPGPGIFNMMYGNTGNDLYISKLDSLGNFVWAKGVGSDYSTEPSDIVLDREGNIITAGHFKFSVDFDPGVGTSMLASAGNSDAFILKLDSNGDYIWAKSIGGADYDKINAIAVDEFNNLYVTGTFIGTSDQNPDTATSNVISAGSYDVFVTKLNKSGEFIWSFGVGGVGDDRGYGISVDKFYNVFTVGMFEDTVDFDPYVGVLSLASMGAADVFVHKLNQCFPSIGVDTITHCGPYTWSDGMTYYQNNYTAVDYLPNSATNGCDSAIFLNLIVINVDTTVIVSSDTLMATQNAVNYQWIDCQNNSPIVGQNNQFFIPSTFGTYAVVINFDGCTDTSACVLYQDNSSVANSTKFFTLLFPNPTTGIITLSPNFSQAYSFYIVDSFGRAVVKSNGNQSGQFEINLSDLANGIYFLALETEDFYYVNRIQLSR